MPLDIGNEEEQEWLLRSDVHIKPRNVTTFLKPNEEMGWKKQVCGLSRCHRTLQPWQPTKSTMSHSPALRRWAAVTHLARSVTAPSLWLSALLYRPCRSRHKSKGSQQRLILPKREPAVIDVDWKGTKVPDSSLDTDSQRKLSRKKPLPLLYPKASISGEWAGLALTGGGPSKTQAAFLWLGKKIDLAQYPGRAALLEILSSDMRWTWANCTFLLFSSLSSWDIWSPYQRHFQYQTKGKVECILLRGVESSSFLKAMAGL